MNALASDICLRFQDGTPFSRSSKTDNAYASTSERVPLE